MGDTDAKPTVPSDDERWAQARARAEWELGDYRWASVILDAYLNPRADAAALKEEMERP